MEKTPATVHREQVMSKLENLLYVVRENVGTEPPSDAQRRLSDLIRMFQDVLNVMNQTDSDEQFVKATNYLTGLVEAKFFMKLRQPAENAEPAPEPVQKEVPKTAIFENMTVQGADGKTRPVDPDNPFAEGIAKMANGAQFGGISVLGGTIDDVPIEIRTALAEALRAQGVPESKINKQLGL